MKKTRILFILGVVLVALMGLQGCCHSGECDKPKLPEKSDKFNFKVTNLTVDEGKLVAYGGKQSVTVNTTIIITIKNGQTTSVSRTYKSDELPVRAGDEIEILFEPSCAEQTEAFFTLPDGTTRTATVSSPSFRWTVPADFNPGMEIKGESRYETDDFIYELTGSVTLIDLE